MAFEMAHIEILSGKHREFEAAFQQALPLFARAKGCHGAALHHIVERETSYVLLVRWNTVEDHMVDFRQSHDFQAWRKLGGRSLPKRLRSFTRSWCCSAVVLTQGAGQEAAEDA